MEQQKVHTGDERKSDQNDAHQRGVSVVQPVLRQTAEMQQLQNAVEAEIWIIKVFPDQNHNDARHQHRDDKQRLDDAGEFLMPDVIQNQRGQ